VFDRLALLPCRLQPAPPQPSPSNRRSSPSLASLLHSTVAYLHRHPCLLPPPLPWARAPPAAAPARRRSWLSSIPPMLRELRACATKEGRCCCARWPPVLHASVGAATAVGGAAARGAGRCYNGRTALLRPLSTGATFRWRHLLPRLSVGAFGWAAPLRTLAAGDTCRWQQGFVGATIGTMRCYYRREESLQLVEAVLPSKFVAASIGGRSCYHRRASMLPLLAVFAASRI
jgi:hypothetical protein